MSKPRILIDSAIFPEVVERLSQHLEVESNPDDMLWSPSELLARLADKDGVLTTGSQRIDAPLLAAAHGHQIGVVVLTGELGGGQVPGQGRARSLDLVGRHLLAIA